MERENAQPSSALSPYFSLLPEIGASNFAPADRIKLMLRRYRAQPIFGVIENKLLLHTYLGSQHVPQAPVLYGAFATKALGAWPRYERAALEAAIAGRTQFVLKSATNGGGTDVLLMNPVRWHAEGWRMANVSAYAEAFLSPHAARWVSEWGQRYEHRGVIVQETIAVPAAGAGAETAVGASEKALETAAETASAAAARVRLFELKVHQGLPAVVP